MNSKDTRSRLDKELKKKAPDYSVIATLLDTLADSEDGKLRFSVEASRMVILPKKGESQIDKKGNPLRFSV